MKTDLIFKKRKRLSRPKPLILTGIIFFILPFLNVIFISIQLNIGFFSISSLLSALHPIQTILLLFSFIVGFGLLAVEKWGYYLFLSYSAILIIHNLYVLFENAVLYNLGALLQTILGSIAILYFIRKDISAPYMKMYPRGWRLEKRKPIELDVFISEKKLITKDLSLSGLYVNWIDCPYQLNDDVMVIFEIGSDKFRLEAGIVRIDAYGVGIAFRNLEKETENRLEKCLSSN